MIFVQELLPNELDNLLVWPNRIRESSARLKDEHTALTF